MGSALGCAHKSKETGKTAKYDTKGGKKVEKEELQGKLRYLGEIGAAIYAIEEKKKHIGHFISFVGEGNKVTFVCHETAKDKIFVAQFTDEEFQTKKEASNITLSYNAVFKSIVTETAKGKVKVSIRENEVTAAFNISSVKDARANQLFTVNLELCLLPKPKAKNMYIIDPIGRMISKRRCNVEEKEKEMRVSKVHMQGVLSAANIAHSRATIESIQKVIVPIREQAAQHSKISSEMMAKVEQMERRIRKLKTRGASNKHPLDLMYEEGGARNFLHLPDAEEHLPIVIPIDERHIDWLKTHLPLSDGESLEILAKPPKDHALASIKDPMLLQAMSIFSKLDNWDMNMFDLEKLTGGNALYVSTYAMLQKLDLINHFKIDDRILRNFLKAVQSGYHPNPYHNKTHAADVTHINYYIMTKGGLIDKLNLPKEDVFAGVLAGAIHDFDHPGFNNNFHTRTNAYLATLYNDRSILENHHCACVFEILRLPQYDILNGFTEEQRRTVRDTIIEMVLATDMGNHAKIFSSFRRRLAEGQEWNERREDALLALSMSIKMADVSNCGRPKFLYLEWAKNIATEFYNQGDFEERRSLTVSPFMDRKKDKTDFPKGQISFMNYVVVPMFEAIAEFLPPVECALQCCSENKEYWQHLE
eukprot:Tbor_TRINITY_DN5650_c3_g3::TRINITY_DN5650_c3_g3_i4::g.9016::m.9016/K13755/PDE1; calcium/calmodulin-dependent 3',5'-cyclic nucleotide phosphodiesterase